MTIAIEDSCAETTGMINFTVREGRVNFVHNFSALFPAQCVLHFHAPEERFMLVEVKVNTKCDRWLLVTMELRGYDNVTSIRPIKNNFFNCFFPDPRYLMTKNNHLYLRYYASGQNGQHHAEFFSFTVRYLSENISKRSSLPLTLTSSLSGYVTSLGLDNGFYYFEYYGSGMIKVPQNYSVMTSFQYFSVFGKLEIKVFNDQVVIDSSAWNSFTEVLSLECNNNVPSPRVYVNVTHIMVDLFAKQSRIQPTIENSGFKLLYSFHSLHLTPTKLKSGLFNCSIPYYVTFRQHLDCNLERECQDGQDETADCPFSSAQCRGKVALGPKCLFLIVHGSPKHKSLDSKATDISWFNWYRAADECRYQGGLPATVKTLQELNTIASLWKWMRFVPRAILIGLKHTWPSKPRIYSTQFRWLDNTNAYSIDPALISELAVSTMNNGQCGMMVKITSVHQNSIVFTECFRNRITFFLTTFMVCETQQTDDTSARATNYKQSLITSASPATWAEHCNRRTLIVCPKGFVTHAFLSCDPLAHCGQERYTAICPMTNAACDNEGTLTNGHKLTSVVSMFMCQDEDNTIHYTLVCDFRSDCPDGSDETFCRHQSCREDQFECSNGQCVAKESKCDTFSDCQDESDEAECLSIKDRINTALKYLKTAMPPPAVIDFDGQGFVTKRHLPANETCPDSHFRCPGKPEYCLPVYTRCNGYNDCLDGEDESGCADVTCSSLYRCRGSNVCVHANYVCDGWAQCPQHDDEWLCRGLICPEGCVCHGLAVVCNQTFLLENLPQVRYLDVQDTPINISNLTAESRSYLTYLRINNGSVSLLSSGFFPNLQFLDLSTNDIEVVNMTILSAMPNLKTLRLSKNPIRVLLCQANQELHGLKVLELKSTQIESVDSSSLSFLSVLLQLDISYTPLLSIGKGGFKHFPHLHSLDLRKTPLKSFSPDLFTGLQNLDVVFTPNYRLCCRDKHPEAVSRHHCFTNVRTLSSCENLLRSRIHIVVLMTISVAAVLGNLICGFVLLMRYKESPQQITFFRLMTNLNAANFVSGVYCGVIASKDFHFKAEYIRFEEDWRRGVLCTVTGVLLELSQIVSSLFVLLITFDRCLEIYCPRNSRWHFDKRSVVVAILLVWSSGLLLAVVPLLPSTSHWEFYSSSGMCVSLPGLFTTDGESYHFTLHAVYQGFISLFVAIGQICIVKKTSSQDSATIALGGLSSYGNAERLFTNIAGLDCLRGAILSGSNLLAYYGLIFIEEDVSAALAIFVVNLNAIVNPYLYLMNRIAAHKGSKMQKRLIMILKIKSGMRPCQSDKFRDKR